MAGTAGAAVEAARETAEAGQALYSDPDAAMRREDVSGSMQLGEEQAKLEEYLVSRRPKPPEAPWLEAAGGGNMRVQWVVPAGEAAFREVSVLMRPVGAAHHHASSSEWWRVDSRTKYLMLEALTVCGFHVESPISQPLQIGRPPTPAAPLLEEAEPGAIRARWVLPAAAPPVERVLLFLRRVEEPEWGLVDNLTRTLVRPDFQGQLQACAAADGEVVVTGLDPDGPYEAKVACLNEHGWSEHSPPSASLQLTRPPSSAVAGWSKWFFQV